MKPIGLALVCGLILGLGACTTLSRADRAPRTDPVARLAPTGPSPWREDFGDPALRNLLDRADLGALDVDVALARLERAAADVEAADAARRLNVVVGVQSAIGGRNFRSSTSGATPTLEVTREVDVWRRLAHARGAARAGQQASAADLAEVRLSIAAQTAQTYLSLRTARTSETAAIRRQAIAQQQQRLIRARAAEGLARPDEVEAGRRTVDRLGQLAEQHRDDGRLLAARLADLSGVAVPITSLSGDLALGADPGPAAGSVVDARPDVRAAFARLAAADEQRASSIAASQPQFQIVAAIGSPDSAISTLLDVRTLAWALAATVSQDVLDGGAARARVHAATADADLADLAYRKTVLVAWSEVRDGVSAVAQTRRDFAMAQASLALARTSLRIGQARHAAGSADGRAIAALDDAVAQADEAVDLARLRIAAARIQLALAKGGG